MTHAPPDAEQEPSPEHATGDPDAPVGSEPEAGSGRETAEVGGPKGLEPTRYGDWERNGRCIDF